MSWLIAIAVVWALASALIGLVLGAIAHDEDPVLEGYEPGPWTTDDDEALEQLLDAHAKERG